MINNSNDMNFIRYSMENFIPDKLLSLPYYTLKTCYSLSKLLKGNKNKC